MMEADIFSEVSCLNTPKATFIVQGNNYF